MSALDERLREIEYETSHGEWIDVPALLRAIRALVEQRDNIATFKPFSQTKVNEDRWIQIMNTAVLAAMDAPGKEQA